jgi:hypothetical protein
MVIGLLRCLCFFIGLFNLVDGRPATAITLWVAGAII